MFKEGSDQISSPRDGGLLPSSLSAIVIAQSAVMDVRSSLFIQKLSKKLSFQILALKDTSVPRQPLRCGHEYLAVSPAVRSLGYWGGSPQPSLAYRPSFLCMERNM